MNLLPNYYCKFRSFGVCCTQRLRGVVTRQERETLSVYPFVMNSLSFIPRHHRIHRSQPLKACAALHRKLVLHSAQYCIMSTAMLKSSNMPLKAALALFVQNLFALNRSAWASSGNTLWYTPCAFQDTLWITQSLIV